MNAPDIRSTCRQCSRSFRMYQVKPGISGLPFPARSKDIHFIDLDGNFCTLRCAARYAVQAAGIPEAAREFLPWFRNFEGAVIVDELQKSAPAYRNFAAAVDAQVTKRKIK